MVASKQLLLLGESYFALSQEGSNSLSMEFDIKQLQYTVQKASAVISFFHNNKHGLHTL